MPAILLLAGGFFAQNAVRAALWGAGAAALGAGVKFAGEGVGEAGEGLRDVAIGAALGVAAFAVIKRL